MQDDLIGPIDVSALLDPLKTTVAVTAPAEEIPLLRFHGWRRNRSTESEIRMPSRDSVDAEP